MKVGKDKELYKGIFNLSQEVIIMRSTATSEGKAKTSMLFRIAKKHQVPLKYVFGLFDGSKDNFIIEKEECSE